MMQKKILCYIVGLACLCACLVACNGENTPSTDTTGPDITGQLTEPDTTQEPEPEPLPYRSPTPTASDLPTWNPSSSKRPSPAARPPT